MKNSNALTLDFVTPDAILSSQEAYMVVIPGEEGEFGVLNNHAPLISNLKQGIVNVYDTKDNVSQRVFITGGFAEVTSERCSIMAEQAYDLDKISKDDTAEMLKQAKHKLLYAASDKEKADAQEDVDTIEKLITLC